MGGRGRLSRSPFRVHRGRRLAGPCFYFFAALASRERERERERERADKSIGQPILFVALPFSFLGYFFLRCTALASAGPPSVMKPFLFLKKKTRKKNEQTNKKAASKPPSPPPVHKSILLYFDSVPTPRFLAISSGVGWRKKEKGGGAEGASILSGSEIRFNKNQFKFGIFICLVVLYVNENTFLGSLGDFLDQLIWFFVFVSLIFLDIRKYYSILLCLTGYWWVWKGFKSKK